VVFFVWTVALEKILTHNLRRRGIVVVEWCVMCKKHGESIDHLLLYCDVAWVVWSYFYILFGVEWVMPSSVLDLLSGWGTLLGRGSAIRIWKQVLLCVLWGLWRERNSKLFEDVEVTVGALCRNVLYCGCRHIARVVCRLLSFYFYVRLFPLIRGSFVYFLCTRVLFNELLIIKKNVSTTIKESAVSILIMAYVMLINKNTLDVYISII